ncbi:hypothetical protein KPL74_20840 [Bacillus sp. NP157]|nr:hypothetical protein KPL74_20840 [Bacillus sp. NP157]
MIELPNLHDARVTSVIVHWTEKVARIRLFDDWPVQAFELVFNDFVSIALARIDDWGPSSAINSLTQVQEGEATRFLIEMQSGDIIDILAARVSFERTDQGKRMLSEPMALEAGHRFLAKMKAYGWPSLPGLLGGMIPIEGRPMDPGVETDWAEEVDAALVDSADSAPRVFSPEAAYEIVYGFLRRQFQRGYESIGDVIDGWVTDPERGDSTFARDWEETVAEVFRPPATNVEARASFVFREKPYFSYLDEKHFFTWLESLDGVLSVKGGPGGLHVSLREPFVTPSTAYDLIGLFRRYGLDPAPFLPHVLPEDLATFRKRGMIPTEASPDPSP